jgi:hypothetical protein
VHGAPAGLRHQPPGTTIKQSTDRSPRDREKYQQIIIFPKTEPFSDGIHDHQGHPSPRTELTTHHAAI